MYKDSVLDNTYSNISHKEYMVFAVGQNVLKHHHLATWKNGNTLTSYITANWQHSKNSVDIMLLFKNEIKEHKLWYEYW